VVSADPDSPPSQSMMRAIQRHREVYQDYASELRRTKVCSCQSSSLLKMGLILRIQANVKHAVEQANLLSGVRNDIEYEF
jgi:Golgi SNAP receptor complex protein 1